MPDDLCSHTPTDDERTARITVDASNTADHPIPVELYGKFAEHLGWNVYHGMDAQLLFNPTFADWAFPARSGTGVDGGRLRESEPDVIRAQIEEFAGVQDLPSSDPLVDAYEDACAFWWMRRGGADDVRLSPDTSPNGDRAQRVEVPGRHGGEPVGVGQWAYLPLQRTDTYRVELRARAVTPATVTVSIESTSDDGTPDRLLASTDVDVPTEWSTIEGTLELEGTDGLDDDHLFSVSVTLDEPANLVLDRVLLYPDDHVDRADPDVVAFLRDADLPLLRWPGGNFVSGYHWRDGVGPRDERPTEPNPAWGGVETHLFGTAEFVEFCDNVGCEPMICVNAGDGTPEEAARWVEYCNGDPEETEMGALRAEHGHEQPFDVEHWEIGNELWGTWQVHWTTPAGNADRYARFRERMLAVDPDIEVRATGTRDGEWNDELLDRAGHTARRITDHVLVGGPIDETTDRTELFHGFVGFADQLGTEYRDLRERMTDAGVEEPRLAITELQLFPRWVGDRPEDRHLPAAWHYSRNVPPEEGFPTKKTISEALFATTVINECVRLGEFPELLTHSAVLNHGGGLRKWKEHVWADPVHYAHELGIELAGGLPVAVDVACTTISTSTSFGQVRPVDDVPALDAIAALDEDDATLRVMIVHRAADIGPIELDLDVDGAVERATAERTVLAGETMAAENGFESRGNVTPESSTVEVVDGRATVTIEPFSLSLFEVPVHSS